MTEAQVRTLRKIGKIAAYTAITGGSYLLARSALSLLLKKMEPKQRNSARTQSEKPQSA